MISVEIQKNIVKKFLNKCNDYSCKQIHKYEKKSKPLINKELLEIKDKTKQWEDYIKCNNYAINELKTTTLDHWFCS